MNCEHCLNTHALDCGVAYAWHRLVGAVGRVLRSVLASLAQLG
jgi:hypothetical protein